MRILALALLLTACAPYNTAVRVNITIPGEGEMTGTGFQVWWNGRPRMLTAGHVCEGALAAGVDYLSLTFVTGDDIATGGLYRVARLSTIDDLCELEAVSAAPHRLRSLIMGDPPNPGDLLTVVGAPYGYYMVTSPAQYIARDVYNKRPAFSAVSSTVAPGNSGSPILDSEGRLVGMLVAGFKFIFVAVPAAQMAAFLNGSGVYAP